MYRRWLRAIDRCVAVSEELKEEMIACGIPPHKIEMIPNCVDTCRYVAIGAGERHAARARLNADANAFIFLFVGRLVERKGVDVLLRAWPQLQAAQTLLWIVGSGAEEARLKQLCEELSLSGVVFHGSQDDPLAFYQAADAFVFPSRLEGSPGVLLEAMSTGLPCIASRIGGITDVITHEQDGLLVAPDSIDELTHAMRSVMQNREMASAMGRKAAERPRKDFALDAVAQKYLNLYQQLSKR
jgi:glycosyltransferase involved in cell wall biosynthesis